MIKLWCVVKCVVILSVNSMLCNVFLFINCKRAIVLRNTTNEVVASGSYSKIDCTKDWYYN